MMSAVDRPSGGDATLAYSVKPQKHATSPFLRVLFEAGRIAPNRPVCYIDKRELVVGRRVGPGDLQLDDSRASRSHARLRSFYSGDQVRIFDTSSNGTFVNGQPVDKECTLYDNSIIQVGDSFLLFRYGSIIPDDDAGSDTHSRALAGLLGEAPAMRQLRHAIATVGPTDATVLIVGDSGTGKELVARAIHEVSGRSGPFIAVNCSAIPESLAESQLFGHIAGSFTGARQSHKGFFQAADGGTLFLDELGELSLAQQPKLLRVLEDCEVTPLGAASAEMVDVRVVAATNANLRQDVQVEKFRGDLYARLAEITISTPPLRERREDILPILASALGPDAPPLAPRLAKALLLYSWPFNVRELLKVAKQLQIQGAGNARLELELIEDRLVEPAPGKKDKSPPDKPAAQTAAPHQPDAGGSGTGPTTEEETDPPVRDKVPTRDEFLALVIETKGNISKLSRTLGRSRRQIYRYIEMYDVAVDQYRDDS